MRASSRRAIRADRRACHCRSNQNHGTMSGGRRGSRTVTSESDRCAKASTGVVIGLLVLIVAACSGAGQPSPDVGHGRTAPGGATETTPDTDDNGGARTARPPPEPSPDTEEGGPADVMGGDDTGRVDSLRATLLAAQACDHLMATMEDGFWDVTKDAAATAREAAEYDLKWSYLAANIEYALERGGIGGASTREYQQYVRSVDNIADECSQVNGLPRLLLDRGGQGYDDGPENGGPPQR
jgi:hypothetical protein